jgi:hypothetical protein
MEDPWYVHQWATGGLEFHEQKNILLGQEDATDLEYNRFVLGEGYAQ